MTPIGVLNFPVFFEPKGNKANPAQATRFSGMLLFDSAGTGSSAYQDLRKAVGQAIEDKFGAAKAADVAFVKSLRLPFRDASEKDYTGFDAGEIFISAWKQGEQEAPGVVNLNGDDIIVPSDVYSGQLARFTVRAFGYDNNGNKGVALGLEHIQIVKADMPRLDNRQTADKAFGSTGDATNDQMAALGIKPGASAPTGTASTAPDADDLPF